MRETQVPSLGQEDPLEKDMATHSSILGLENPKDRGAWGATVCGVVKSRTRLSSWAPGGLQAQRDLGAAESRS